MPSREILLQLAGKEEGVSVLTNPQRVAEYFASYREFAGKNEQAMLNTSWCQIFLNWALLKAGYPIFQRKYGEWLTNAKDDIDDGFQYILQSKKTYKPKPGDIYYAQWVRGKKTDHMGFIVKDHGNGRYRTLDGNTANVGHQHYGKTLWGGTRSGALTGGIGGGVVCFNERTDNGGRTKDKDIGIDGFIPLPLMIYTKNPYA